MVWAWGRPRGAADWARAGLTAACIVFVGGPAFAGAWPQAAGHGQLIVTSTYDWANRSYDGSGDAVDVVDYNKSELSLFGEFGLTSRLTLVGRAAIQDVVIDSVNGRDAASGFGATEIGIRALAFQRGLDVFSAQAALIVPGEVENVSDLYLGEGGNDYEARVLYGRSFAALGGNAFAEAQAGWRWRSGPPPDEARVDLTLGLEKGGWTGLAQAFAIYGSGATPPRRDYENLKLQASVLRDVAPATKLQLGAFQTVAGRSIVRETAVFAGLWRSF